MRLPEWMRKLRANLGGYFWLPCPICGEMFGGFEASSQCITKEVYKTNDCITGSTGECVCPKKECIEEAKNRNMRNFGVS